jgi:DNA-binding MarR family transcriptional regulator
MSSLRASQIETLETSSELEAKFGPFEAGDLAWRIKVQTPAAARRLKGLVATGHMQVEPSESDHRRFYSLTDAGRSELSNQQGGG